MSNAFTNLIILLIAVSSPLLFWFLAYKTIRDHLAEVKAVYLTAETKVYENLNVYFKNFDISKKKQFFPNSNTLEEPIYTFSSCDLYFNEDSLLLVGKMKAFFQILDINITVFKRDQSKILGKTLKSIQCTKTHIEIEFTDSRFEKRITAMVRLPKDSNMVKLLEDWN